MTVSQRSSLSVFVHKIKTNPASAHISADDELFSLFLKFRHSLQAEGNQPYSRLMDQILGLGRQAGVGGKSVASPSNPNQILAFPHMSDNTGPFPHTLQTDLNQQTVEGGSTQPAGFLMDETPESTFISRPTGFDKPINSGTEFQQVGISTSIGYPSNDFTLQAQKFTYEKNGASPPLNPFNTERIYQATPTPTDIPPLPTLYKEISASGLENVRKEVENLNLENPKLKTQTTFEEEVAIGESAKRDRDLSLLQEKLNELSGKRPANVGGGGAQKKTKTEEKDIWKSGISRSRKNNLVLSSNQENHMTVYDSDAISIYCGYGFPPIDRPGKVDDSNEDSRKRPAFPAFYLRTETNDFNSVVQLRPQQIAMVIESLQISYALTTKKLSPTEFIPENDSIENRRRWAKLCSHPVTDNAIVNQFTQIKAARESNSSVIIN